MKHYQGKYLKSSASRPFLWIGIGCSILALVFACFLGKYLWDAIQAARERQQAIQAYVSDSPSPPEAARIPLPQESAAPEPEDSDGEEAGETAGETTAPTEPPRFPTIDFAGLQAESPAVVAWLQVPALEVINYPVVLGQDNAFFSQHGWDGEESDHGAIYLDFRNQGDFSQVHNILYGHCMKDGTMFQSLGQWESSAFFQTGDRTILLYLPEETRVYEIFAVERVNALDNRVYRTDYAADQVWLAALEETLQKALLHTDPELTASAEVLSLSTCVGSTIRLVIHALCIERVAPGN